MGYISAEGKAEGKEIGFHDKAVEVAKSAIKMGLNEDQIVQLTGLSLEEIQALEIEVNS